MIELLKEFMGLPLKNKILTAPFYAFVFFVPCCVIVGVCCLLVLAVSERAREIAWYRSVYHVPVAEIYSPPPQPLDCEFSRAPFGDKGCHYEKRAEFVGDDAARYSEWPYAQLLSHIYPKAVWIRWVKLVEP